MTSQRIVFGQMQEPALPPEQLPPRELHTGKGTTPHGPFQIYLVAGLYETILAHINETPNIESGGILVGHAFRTPDQRTTFIVITAAIRQDSNDRSVGHFTVSPAEVQEARVRLEAHYPGHQVVGWYHSHPGHGVFLSGQDMTIVRSIYNASWQLALVIDPLNRLEGFFVGPQGELLGGGSPRALGNSWTELHRMPAGVAARTYFNQAQEAAESGHRDTAVAALNALLALLRDEPELRHWAKDYPGYAELRRRVEDMDDNLSAPLDSPASGDRSAVRSSRQTPVRVAPPRQTHGHLLWPTFALLGAILVGYFVVVLLTLRQQALTASLVAWGSALTLIIGLAALVLLSRERGRSEQALGYTLLAAVLLVWVGFSTLAFSSGVRLDASTESAPAVLTTPKAATLPATISETETPPASSTVELLPAPAGLPSVESSPAPLASFTAEPPPTPIIIPSAVSSPTLAPSPTTTSDASDNLEPDTNG